MLLKSASSSSFDKSILQKCQEWELWVTALTVLQMVELYKDLLIPFLLPLEILDSAKYYLQVWITVLYFFINIYIFLSFYFSVYSLGFVSIEKTYQHTTTNSVSSDFPKANTSNVVKNTSLRVVFSTLFSVIENQMKHCLSCLIYYLKKLIRMDIKG